MATDVIAGLRGLFERSDGKRMSQINKPGTTAARLTGNAGGVEHLVKRLLHHGVGEFAMTARDKEVRVSTRNLLATVEIAVKCRPRRLVQGQQAAFVKLQQF